MKRALFFTSILLVVIAGGCSLLQRGPSPEELQATGVAETLAATQLTPAPTATPTTDLTHALDGLWISDVANQILDIHDQQASLYKLTQVSCVGPFATTPLEYHGSEAYWLLWKLTLSGDTLFVWSDPYSKITELPDLCKSKEALTQDPVVNFEVLWHTFQENYAYFEERKVDWQAQYDQYRPEVKADMSYTALFSLMSDLLAPINDAHVFLSSPSNQYIPAVENPEWAKNSSREQTIMSDYFNYKMKTAGNGNLAYGKLNDIGYIEIKILSGYASAFAEEGAAAAGAIDQVIQEIGDVKAIIVDVRFSGGGWDEVLLALASRFADQRRLVFTYERRTGDGFTQPSEVFLEPGGKVQFTKPVFLLTSNFAFSGAEGFVLAMRVLPNVKIIGERTRGCFSQSIYMLPNGWWFGLNNFKQTAADGKNYEVVGIPPDIEMAMKKYDPEGKDEILEKAIELASEVK